MSRSEYPNRIEVMLLNDAKHCNVKLSGIWQLYCIMRWFEWKMENAKVHRKQLLEWSEQRRAHKNRWQWSTWTKEVRHNLWFCCGAVFCASPLTTVRSSVGSSTWCDWTHFLANLNIPMNGCIDIFVTIVRSSINSFTGTPWRRELLRKTMKTLRIYFGFADMQKPIRTTKNRAPVRFCTQPMRIHYFKTIAFHQKK